MPDDTYTGVCTGGPLNGQEVTVRFPDGFLAVDKPAGLAWIYKRDPGGTFTVCLDHDDSLIYPQGTATGERVFDAQRAWSAAEGMTVEIVAVDGAVH